MNKPRVPRYTFYQYSETHWAVDCEDCGCKIANLTANRSSNEVIDRITLHEKKFHDTR